MRFFAELKRRKVIQTAVLYAVSAWVLLQVAELLLDMLEVPRWGLKLVFVLLLIGFPLALLLSWMHQLTPSGLQRESAPKPPPTGAPASQTSTAAPSAATVGCQGCASWRARRRSPSRVGQSARAKSPASLK
jgi:hypothetical protein